MLRTGSAVDEIIGADGRPDGFHVVLLQLAQGDGDDFAQWVITDVGALIAHLRQTLGPVAGEASDERPLAIVVWSAEAATPRELAAMEACWQAVRGVVQSLTLERGAKNERLNAVRAMHGMDAALRDTLAFLASERGSFVAGASLDLRPSS